MANTSIKFRLFSADGLPAEGLLVSARLTRPDTDAGSVVPVTTISGKTDETGECILALWPNARGTTGSQYDVSVSMLGTTVDKYKITVPESLSTVLVESIKSTPPYPTVSAAQQALEAAQQAVIDAADASRLSIGTVTTLDPGEDATATITGDAGEQVLNLGIPKGDTGAGGEGGGTGATNLAYTASPTGGTVTSDTGTDATLPLADGTNAGLMAPAQHSKLAGIAAGATAVTVDAAPTDGSSNAVSSNGVFDALAGKSDTSHNHAGTYDPAGTASAALSAHTGAADPHPGYVLESTIGAAGGVASLDGAGQVPAAQIPAIAITELLGTVASQSAMLALSGQKGDWCIRTDTGTTWIITGADPSLLAGWTELVYPAAPVSSVAGRTGAVTLTSSDLTDTTAAGRALLDDADAAAQRSTLGLGDAATKSVGTAAGTVAAGDDARLSDARTPTSHTHALADLTQSSASTGQVPTWNGSAWVAATPSGGTGEDTYARRLSKLNLSGY